MFNFMGYSFPTLPQGEISILAYSFNGQIGIVKEMTIPGFDENDAKKLVLQIILLNLVKKSLTGNTKLFGSETFVVIGIV